MRWQVYNRLMDNTYNRQAIRLVTGIGKLTALASHFSAVILV